MSSEVWGAALLLLSLVFTLFLVGAGGQLGETAKSVFSFLFGKWTPLGPLALLGMGLVLVLGKPALSKRRLFFGTALFFVSTLALFHLLTGAPPLAGGAEAVRERGGAVGALISFPLQRVTGGSVTFLILAVGVTAGVLLLTKTSLKDFLLAMGELIRWLPGLFRRRKAPAVPGAPAPISDASPAPPGGSRLKRVLRRVRRRRKGGKAPTEGPWPIAPVLEVPGPGVPTEDRSDAAHPSDPDPDPAPSPVSGEDGRGGGPHHGDGEPRPRPAPPRIGGGPTRWSRHRGEQRTRPGRRGAGAGGRGHRRRRRGGCGSLPLPSAGLPEAGRGRRGATGKASRARPGTCARRWPTTAWTPRITGVVSGPSVTRFEIKLAPGVKVQKLSALSNDIAYALATPDVRLLVPIPGRSAIGIEVPNAMRQLVRLGDILSGRRAGTRRHPLVVGLGMDIAGKPFLLNLAELPHVLIAGATGSGKSSCINSIITSLLMRARPDDLKLILVDPKRVELGQFRDVPHLLTRVITDPKKASEALKWVVAEMDRRYDLLAEAGVRDISGYAAKWEKGSLDTARFDRFPYLVVVVDELNDLMMVAGREVEMAIVRIAQMARAVGIHLVLATQRPSVNVITGVIKANVPSRLAFSVASQTDSRVIIDGAGAEKLVGRGDMLVVTAQRPRPQRVQGAWVEESEIARVVSWIRGQGRPAETLDQSLDAALTVDSPAPEPEDDEDEKLLGQATELVVRSQLGSTSMLQRKLRVGIRPGRTSDGHPGTERRGRALPGLQGEGSADHPRGTRRRLSGPPPLRRAGRGGSPQPRTGRGPGAMRPINPPTLVNDATRERVSRS